MSRGLGDVYKRQELTITPEISSFLAENECEKFDIYNEKLMVGSNRTKLLKELER